MYRNRRILDEARNHPCQVCGADDGTIVAAHSNSQRHGKGMGIKAHDIVCYACATCHRFIDQGSAPRAVREQVWLDAARKSLPLYEHLLDEHGWRVAMEVLSEA